MAKATAAVERDDDAAAVQPLLRQALRLVAHPTIRNRGTSVGSLAHADPSGELTAVLEEADAAALARAIDVDPIFEQVINARELAPHADRPGDRGAGDLQDALDFVERAYVLENGRTVLEGSRDALLGDSAFAAKFLGLA